MENTYQLTDNTASKRFQIEVDGHLAIVEYILAEDRIFLTHTEVPAALGRRGIGSALVKSVLEEVEKRNLTLIPLCPFVASYIKKYPEWKKLVLKGINIE